MTKKPVFSSHLALRFYKGNGWTKEILDQYLLQGRVVDQIEGQEVRDYWLLDHRQGSRFDMDRLYADDIGEVIKFFENGIKDNKTDLEFLKGMNW